MSQQLDIQRPRPGSGIGCLGFKPYSAGYAARLLPTSMSSAGISGSSAPGARRQRQRWIGLPGKPLIDREGSRSVTKRARSDTRLLRLRRQGSAAPLLRCRLRRARRSISRGGTHERARHRIGAGQARHRHRADLAACRARRQAGLRLRQGRLPLAGKASDRPIGDGRAEDRAQRRQLGAPPTPASSSTGSANWCRQRTSACRPPA